MTTTVVVPTYRRPDELVRCLDALERQAQLPDEVLIAVRSDDRLTAARLQARERGALTIRIVPVGLANASMARNCCIARAIGDIIAFTDDDAEPRRDWISNITCRFARDPWLGGLGGPDWIPGITANASTPPHRVGVVQWHGRRIGNHHLGAPGTREADWLKGANMSFRRAALAGIRFGSLLRGDAAQFGEDLALSLEVKRAGWTLCYDAAVAVDHHPARLPAGRDHRDLADAVSLADAAHNDTVILLGHLGPFRRVVFLAWSLVIGTRLLPGLVAALLPGHRGRRVEFARWRVVTRGRLEGWRTWRAARSDRAGHPVGSVPMARRFHAPG